MVCQLLTATSLDATLSGGGVKANEIGGEVLQHSEIVSGMTAASAHLVIGEGDIHAPMQAVLHAPVRADGGAQAVRLRGQAADVEALFDRRLAVHAMLRFDDIEGLQIGPLRHSSDGFPGDRDPSRWSRPSCAAFYPGPS